MKTIKKLKSYLLRSLLFLLPLGLLGLAWPHLASAQAKPDWEQRWEKVLTGAKKEGKVVVWGPPGEQIRDSMTQSFKKAFPDITIEYSGARGGELAAKIRPERDGGVYSTDVVLSGTTTALVYFKPMKALDPIEPALILPEVTNLQHWRNNTLEFADTETRSNLVFSVQAQPVAIYDRKQVKIEEIDEVHKLLDPKWKGKILINDPLPSGVGSGTFRWLWQVLGPAKATDYYRKIRSQAGAVTRDYRSQIEWIHQGKYAILFGPATTMYQLEKVGLKFETLADFKDYGGVLSAGFGSLMLLNKAPHPNAATVFVNWLLSRDGQKAWTKGMGYPSRRLDVPPDGVPWYWIPRAGVKYGIIYTEEESQRSAAEEKILKELFGR